MSEIIREWRFYIDDMIRFAENVIAYSEGFTQLDFVNSGLNYDATLRNLELIGEAATHIPEEIRQAYLAIPWRQIIATRNRLIHGYLGIDDDILWSIIETDIPALLVELELFQKNDYTQWQNKSVESLLGQAQEAWDRTEQ
jgi:uncharacterized protein with HEPN domain